MKLAAYVLTSALTMAATAPVAEAARLAVRGSGGTIVNDGTGDASNADETASGDTDTLTELGFDSLTLASDLANLEIFVSAFNGDPSSFPDANAALLTTLRVFFTVDEPCNVSPGVPCADVESVSEDGTFSDVLTYEAGGGFFDESQQIVLAYVDIVSPPGTVLQFGTLYSYLLGNFADESALAALLAGATRQADSTGFDLSQISLGFAAVFSGGQLLGGTFTDLEAPVDGEVSTAAAPVPEPGSLLLLGTGLMLVGARARRRLRRRG